MRKLLLTLALAAACAPAFAKPTEGAGTQLLAATPQQG